MLKKSVPPFVAQMREMAELFGAEQPELDRLEGILTELLAQSEPVGTGFGDC